MNNTCQIQGHQGKRILSICFSTKCKENRACCQMCIHRLHKDHTDQLVDIVYLLDYIKTESNKPSVLQPQVNQRVQELQNFFKHVELLSKLITEEIEKLNSLNVQQICKTLGNKYNILKENFQGLSIQNWNNLANDILQNLWVDDCNILLKDPSDPLQRSLTTIIKDFMQLQQELTTIESKDYLLKFKEAQLFQGHTGAVKGIDICKHRELLASGSADKTVRLWNLKNNTLIRTYEYSGEVYDVTFSKQGNLLAFGGRGDHKISLIDISDLNNKETIPTKLCGTGNTICRLTFSNDAKYLISGGGDEKVCVWDLSTYKEKFQLKSEDTVYGVAISRDDNMIASNSNDGKIRIWTLQDQKLVCSQSAHKNGSGIQFSNDQKMIVSSGSDGKIKLWSLEELNQKKVILIREFSSANNDISTVLFSPCCEYIVSISNQDSEIKVINQLTGCEVKLFTSYQSNNLQQNINIDSKIAGLAISEDMEIIAYGENNNFVLRKKQ